MGIKYLGIRLAQAAGDQVALLAHRLLDLAERLLEMRPACFSVLSGILRDGRPDGAQMGQRPDGNPFRDGNGL